MKWTANEVRKTFLEYFKEKGHTIVPSSPLLPKGDPTLLFTNAGMNQFKLFFLGKVTPPYKRATSCQKCMRAGGKHNDLDNVGFTKRHHTFFEMLGNFSFGDYFKEEAIKFAWELLTEIYKLPKERLWITVYEKDDEATSIWRNTIGVSEERIIKLGVKDNFWEMGEIGPAGPCSEILYDLGEEEDPAQKDPSMEGERFLELWNLVFMQFNREEDGNLVPLPNKNIDTGMGLERLLRILQSTDSNYHTDLFMPIIEEVERITGVKYHGDEKGSAHRVLADHSRALTFAIADGIYPSNYGRGYVLRRILRRAHRFAQKIGFEEKPIIYRLVPVVIEVMHEAYPELVDKKTEIEFIIKREEEKFIENIARNLPRLREDIESYRENGTVDGKVVFKYYDTYGLPLDLIEEYIKEAGLQIDWSGFEDEMSKQRERGRKKEIFKVEIPEWKILKEGKSKFVGYEKLQTVSSILKYGFKDKKVYLVTEETPFYAESGGQVGDKGIIEGEWKGGKFLIRVQDTQKIGDDIVHIGELEQGKIPEDSMEVRLEVDEKKRLATQRAHTATHLLHAALREVLGEHVRQEGSLVEPDRLRFDFLHFKKLSDDEIEEIERIVNNKIMENIKLKIEWKDYRDAVKEGAMALFEGKYGEKVRVISIGDFSKELCGGTHVNQTGDIGFFKIIKEEASSANIRRIEAYTGEKAFEYVKALERRLENIASLLGTASTTVEEKLKKLEEEYKEKEEVLEALTQKLAEIYAEEIVSHTIHLNNEIPVYYGYYKNLRREDLRKIADRVRLKVERGILVLLSSFKESVNIFVEILGDVEGFDARKIMRNIGKIIGGGGGGSERKAEGGGRKKEKIGEILELIKKGTLFVEEV